MAVKAWAHFLRDVKFVLRTDHRNLQYIDTSEDSKVKRWKVELQNYKFDVEWIPGDENVVADILSRQLPMETLHAAEHAITHMYYTGSISFNGSTREANAHSVIAEFHTAAVGHFGWESTFKRLQSKQISWPTMEADVRAFVRACPTCQKLSQTSFAVTTTPFTNTTYSPMARLNIDTIGPLPIDSFGNSYIIVVIDTFTRFVELYRASDATAFSAAQALLEHCGRYGVPDEILTDNGPQYFNKVIEHLTQLLHVQHLYTVPYSHEENGVVERANKEVGRHLRAILLDHRSSKTWSQELPLVQNILNSKVHEATGVAPATLVFGGMVDINRGLFPSLPPANNSSTQFESMNEYVQQLKKTQDRLIDQAALHQQNREELQRAKKGTRMATEFETGSYVLVSFPDNKRPSKLHAPLQGPFRVIGTVPSVDGTTPTEYILFDSTTQREVNAGVHRLRPYHHDPIYTDPTLVAITDKDAFIIESIIGHKPKIKNSEFVKLPKSRLSFLVKYQGYEEPEWNTWTNLRTNIHLHRYLRHQGLASLVPKNILHENSL